MNYLVVLPQTVHADVGIYPSNLPVCALCLFYVSNICALPNSVFAAARRDLALGDRGGAGGRFGGDRAAPAALAQAAAQARTESGQPHTGSQGPWCSAGWRSDCCVRAAAESSAELE